MDLPSSTLLSCMAHSASDVYLIFPCSLPPSLFLWALENLPDGVMLELCPVQDPDHKRPDRPIPTDPAPSFPELPLRISNVYPLCLQKRGSGRDECAWKKKRKNPNSKREVRKRSPARPASGRLVFTGSVCNLLRAVGKIYSNEKQPRSEKAGL